MTLFTRHRFLKSPLHSSSFVDVSPSQSLSLTEELSVNVGDPTADSVAQPTPSTTGDYITQPSPSTESLTFICGYTYTEGEIMQYTVFT